MKKVEGGVEVKDAEIVEEIQAIPDDFSNLPERQEEKGTWKARKDHSKVRNAVSKAESKKDEVRLAKLCISGTKGKSGRNRKITR